MTDELQTTLSARIEWEEGGDGEKCEGCGEIGWRGSHRMLLAVMYGNRVLERTSGFVFCAPCFWIIQEESP